MAKMTETVSPLLERTAEILADSARLLLEIEDGIAPLLARHHPDNDDRDARFRASLAALQKIDLLSQTLADLSFWLDDLACETRRKVTGTLAPEAAVTRMRLSDLRLRLTGHGESATKDVLSQPVVF